MGPKDLRDEVMELKADLRAWVRKDQEDHVALREQGEETRDVCYELKIETAKQTVTLQHISDAVREWKEQGKTEADKDEKRKLAKSDHKTKLLLWLLGVLGSLATGVTLHYLTK